MEAAVDPHVNCTKSWITYSGFGCSDHLRNVNVRTTGQTDPELQQPIRSCLSLNCYRKRSNPTTQAHDQRRITLLVKKAASLKMLKQQRFSFFFKHLHRGIWRPIKILHVSKLLNYYIRVLMLTHKLTEKTTETRYIWNVIQIPASNTFLIHRSQTWLSGDRGVFPSFWRPARSTRTRLLLSAPLPPPLSSFTDGACRASATLCSHKATHCQTNSGQ